MSIHKKTFLQNWIDRNYFNLRLAAWISAGIPLAVAAYSLGAKAADFNERLSIVERNCGELNIKFDTLLNWFGIPKPKGVR